MKRLIAAAGVAAATLVGSTVVSLATPSFGIPDFAGIGNYAGSLPTGTPATVSIANTTVGGTYDFFAFTVPSAQNMSYTYKADLTTTDDPTLIQFLSFGFFSAPNASAELATGSIYVDAVSGNDKGYIKPYTFSTPGVYYIGVTAQGANGEPYSGTLSSLARSTVPLPGSVAMFGAAVAGLGLAGALRRGKSVSA